MAIDADIMYLRVCVCVRMMSMPMLILVMIFTLEWTVKSVFTAKLTQSLARWNFRPRSASLFL